MVEPVKQLQTTYDDNLIIPEVLKRTVDNYRKAHHTIKFEQKEQDYIEYNTLRELHKDTEEIRIFKVQRLYDRDTQEEKIVYYQKSRCKDSNNNYVECPIVEKIGVVPRPIANISNDSRNRVQDVTVIEIENDYYIPYSKEKLIELFESSKDRHKIVCYVGYTRPTRANPSDTIEGKRIIWNQDKFVNATFNELTDNDEDVIKVLDTRKQYIIPNKIRDVNKARATINNKSQKVESLAELTKNMSNIKTLNGNDIWKSTKDEPNTKDIVEETEEEYKELNNKKQ